MIVRLNPRMVAKQCLCRRDVQRLIVLHAKKDWIFARAAAGEDPVYLLRMLRRIEFAMQAVWKFERDESKHTWKYLMPNTPCDPSKSSTWVKVYVAAMKRHAKCYTGDYACH